MAADHSPDSCPGLARLDARANGLEALFLATRNFWETRLNELRDNGAKQTKAVQDFVEDVRKQANVAARDVEGRTQADLRRADDSFKESFRRVGDIEKRIAEDAPPIAEISGLTRDVANLKKHVALQWATVIALSILALGKGAAWLWPLILGGRP